MADGIDLALVADAIRNGRVRWQRHALKRMVERGITRADVLSVVQGGEVIEDYPSDTPYPSALVLGFVGDRPLHVVVAFDRTRAYAHVVTVYEPDTDRFEPDLRTRRRP
jgi:hypothetical protein